MQEQLHKHETAAFPPRYWWRRRIIACYLLLIAAVLVLRWRVGAVIQRRLDAQIQRLRARGEPVTIGDFVEPVVADEENAALCLRRAGEALVKAKETPEYEADLDSLPASLPLSAVDVALMQKLMVRHTDVLGLARSARGRPKVAWGMKMESPAIGVLLPWISSQRELSNLLRAAALYAHQTGDHAAAVEYIRDMLTISRAVDRSPVLITHLVAISVSTNATNAAMSISPTLRVRGDVKAATPEQVRALITEMLEDQDSAGAMVRAMQGERMFQIDVVTCIANGRLNLADLSWPRRPANAGDMVGNAAARMVRPLLINEAVQMMSWSTQFVEACREGDNVSAAAKFPPPVFRNYRQPLLSLIVPTMGSAVSRHFGGIYQSRKAAIEVAERLYEVDHGRPPRRLEDLVPDYLPKVPQDPVTGKGAAMPFTPATQPTTAPAQPQ